RPPGRRLRPHRRPQVAGHPDRDRRRHRACGGRARGPRAHERRPCRRGAALPHQAPGRARRPMAPRRLRPPGPRAAARPDRPAAAVPAAGARARRAAAGAQAAGRPGAGGVALTNSGTTAVRILILGGYGTFGGRLAQLLADEPRLTLIIAGRSRDKAQAFCSTLGATAVPAAFARDGALEPQLRALAPDLLVDATGPFQSYGDDPYRVVRAALALGIHYLDLADASGFVAGIVQFDGEARRRGMFVLAGVSSFPVLTAA